MRPDPLNRRPAPAGARLLVALVALLVCEPLAAQVFLPARRVVPSVSTALPAPLDIVASPNGWYAWSVSRKLRTAWTGSAYRVYRSSDGLSNDIGFTASGAVDTNALISWVGTNTGWARIVYDQSGNGTHLDGITAGVTNIMQVASNGVVVIDRNGWPTAWHYGLQNSFILAASTDAPVTLSNTTFLVTTPLVASAQNATPVDTIVNLGTAHSGTVNITGNRFDLVNDALISTGCTSAPIVLGRQYQVVALFRSNQTEVVQVNFDAANNTTSIAAGNVNSGTPTIGYNASAKSAQHFFYEWLRFPAEAATNDWAAVAQNQIAYYGIAYPTVAVTNSAFADGGNDWVSLTSSGPTGLADGKTFTFSGWVKLWADSIWHPLANFGTSGPATRFLVRIENTGVIRVFAVNSSGSTILDISSTATITSSEGWVHVYTCIDLTDTTKRKIYKNGVSSSLTVTTWSDDTIDFIGANYIYRFGADIFGVDNVYGGVSQDWFDDSYLDNVSAFYNSGQPVNLGTSGETPTGSSPVFYMMGSGNGFNVNSGTGGNFTVTGNLGSMWPPGANPQ